MKNISNYITLILFCITSLISNAQSQSAAVLSVYTQSAKISPERAESVLRVESKSCYPELSSSEM